MLTHKAHVGEPRLGTPPTFLSSAIPALLCQLYGDSCVSEELKAITRSFDFDGHQTHLAAVNSPVRSNRKQPSLLRSGCRCSTPIPFDEFFTFILWLFSLQPARLTHREPAGPRHPLSRDGVVLRPTLLVSPQRSWCERAADPFAGLRPPDPLPLPAPLRPSLVPPRERLLRGSPAHDSLPQGLLLGNPTPDT